MNKPARTVAARQRSMACYARVLSVNGAVCVSSQQGQPDGAGQYNRTGSSVVEQRPHKTPCAGPIPALSTVRRAAMRRCGRRMGVCAFACAHPRIVTHGGEAAGAALGIRGALLKTLSRLCPASVTSNSNSTMEKLFDISCTSRGRRCGTGSYQHRGSSHPRARISRQFRPRRQHLCGGC